MSTPAPLTAFSQARLSTAGFVTPFVTHFVILEVGQVVDVFGECGETSGQSVEIGFGFCAVDRAG